MASVNFLRRCNFTHDNGVQEAFGPGVVEIPDALADHWFIRDHTDKPVQLPPQPGSPQAADQAAKALRRRRLLDAAQEELEASDPDAKRERLAKEGPNANRAGTPASPLTGIDPAFVYPNSPAQEELEKCEVERTSRRQLDKSDDKELEAARVEQQGNQLA